MQSATKLSQIQPFPSKADEPKEAAPAPEKKDKPKKTGPKEKQYIFSYERLFWSISRGICSILMQGFIIMSFEYAVKAQMNPGIVASIFATNLIFTMAFFLFVYG